MSQNNSKSDLREYLFEVVFESNTREGKLFDLVVMGAIILSTLIVLFESVQEIHDRVGNIFTYIEYGFTVIFTLEYVLRLWTARKWKGYAFSFFGIVDLLSILPTYLAMFITSSQYLMVIRIFRLMRVFRVLKLGRTLREANVLLNSVKASRAKIAVFLFAVVNVAIIMGAVMYIVEGPENGFTSIPRGIYWAVVTMTTVGFGDIHPHTFFGQLIATGLMILGYGIVAVPTGLVSMEMIREQRKPLSEEQLLARHCFNCGLAGHTEDANYCRKCGAEL